MVMDDVEGGLGQRTGQVPALGFIRPEAPLTTFARRAQDQGPGGATRPRFDVEVAGLLQAQSHQRAWQRLAERALESNAFMEPAFALAAARHLSENRRPHFVFVWRSGVPRTDDGALVAVIALGVPRRGYFFLQIRGWRHRQAVLGTPLVDRRDALAGMAVFFDWLAREMPHSAGILLPDIDEDGPVACVIRAVAVSTGHSILRYGAHQRAVLRGGESYDAFAARALSSKRRKKFRRAQRRLSDTGALQVVRATTPAAVRAACEAYLRLESEGWKGQAGTAFLRSASGAAFMRAATRGLAAMGHCRVDLLMAGERIVAAAIILGGQDRALFWKTAYDEAFAAYSPGVQLVLESTRLQLAEPDMGLTDSCAVADHPMIDLIWPDRVRIADWMVLLKPRRSARAQALIVAEGLSRALRTQARRLLGRS